MSIFDFGYVARVKLFRSNLIFIDIFLMYANAHSVQIEYKHFTLPCFDLMFSTACLATLADGPTVITALASELWSACSSSSAT